MGERDRLAEAKPAGNPNSRRGREGEPELRKAGGRPGRKLVKVMEQYTELFVGIDVAKRTLEVALSSGESWTVNNDAAGVAGVGVQFLNVDSKDRAKWLEFIGEIEALTGSHKVSESESGLPSVGPADQKSERRAFTRTTASFMVRFRTRERLEHFIANNVSQGGMFLRTPVLRPIGERVQVVIIHPETDRDFEIEAEVAHTNEHGTPENPKGMGLKFHELRPETKTALDAFIKGTKS